MTKGNSGQFSGKVAFVTGGASGIGRATAIAFAKAGASVAVVDVSEKGMAETVRVIEGLGGRAIAIRCDVSQSASVRSAIDKTVATLGRLDAAVNNAGIEQPVGHLADIAEEFWDRIMGVNLRGVFLCMKYEIEVMLRQRGGTIVNTSSGAGVLAIQGQAAYCATKFGVSCISKVAALEYAAKNIRINAVCPGITDTPMMSRFTGDTEEGRARVIAQEPVGRMARPEEIADAVLWLSSEQTGFVTGHALVIDGGQTAGM